MFAVNFSSREHLNPAKVNKFMAPDAWFASIEDAKEKIHGIFPEAQELSVPAEFDAATFEVAVPSAENIRISVWQMAEASSFFASVLAEIPEIG